MSKSLISIRPFQISDETEVVELWQICKLIMPWNNPHKDIIRKKDIFPELFLVGILENHLISTIMGGYDGHRGCVNYLAVHPDFQKKGYGRDMMKFLESKLEGMGCAKINLNVRNGNDSTIQFYKNLGYTIDQSISMGKRLENDL